MCLRLHEIAMQPQPKVRQSLSNVYWMQTWLREPGNEGGENRDLSGADLSAANLTGAEATARQLAQASDLNGATMPDGTVHE